MPCYALDLFAHSLAAEFQHFFCLQFGRSALHHAALNGSMGAAKVLIERGARLDIRSLDGRTPFNYAAENLKVEMLQYLSHCAQEVTLFKVPG